MWRCNFHTKLSTERRSGWWQLWGQRVQLRMLPMSFLLPIWPLLKLLSTRQQRSAILSEFRLIFEADHPRIINDLDICNMIEPFAV